MTDWQPGMTVTTLRLKTFTPVIDTGVVTIAADWTLLAAIGTKVGGTTQILVRLQRTSTNLTANSAGDLTDTAMFTVNSGWRPNASAYGSELQPFVISDGFGNGSALLNPSTGICNASTWVPSQSITTARFLRILLTYAS